MKQLKEQLQMYGASTLSTAELLAYLLSHGAARTDSLTLACKLLDTYGIKRLRNADVAELCGGGLSRTQAQRLHAICELVQRFALSESGEHPSIVSPDDAASILRPMMMHLDHEALRVLVLDAKNRVIANIQLYTGTVKSSVLRAAEVFRPAITRNSPGIILAHNHPSGEPNPSQEDIETTKQLVEAGKLLDIDVLDHLIIGNPTYVSLKERMRW